MPDMFWKVFHLFLVSLWVTMCLSLGISTGSWTGVSAYYPLAGFCLVMILFELVALLCAPVSTKWALDAPHDSADKPMSSFNTLYLHWVVVAICLLPVILLELYGSKLGLWGWLFAAVVFKDIPRLFVFLMARRNIKLFI